MSTRDLYRHELAEVRLVFDEGLDVRRVRIDERGGLPNWAARIGALLQGKPYLKDSAMTIGNTSYFPRYLTEDLIDMEWLMHQLTHQWQYQHDGIRYLYETSFVVNREYFNVAANETASNALRRYTSEGKKFKDFNREQQANIVVDCFRRLRLRQDVSAWEPFLNEVRMPRK